MKITDSELQQYLPLAVLKLVKIKIGHIRTRVATVLTACGIETRYHILACIDPMFEGCNSTYRL